MDDVTLPIFTGEKPRLSPEETEWRRDHVRVGDSENRLEGVFRDPKTAPVFAAYMRGDIEVTDIVPSYIYPDVDPDGAAIKNRLGVQTHAGPGAVFVFQGRTPWG